MQTRPAFEPEFFQIAQVLVGLTVKISAHQQVGADVGRFFEYLAGRNIAKSAGVGIGDEDVAVAEATVAGVDPHLVGIDARFFQHGHHGGQLEGRTWIGPHRKGVVLVIHKLVRALTGEVSHGLDFARRHFHHNHAAVVGLKFIQGVFQGRLGHVLKIDVERGVDIVTRFGSDIHLVGHGYTVAVG